MPKFYNKVNGMIVDYPEEAAALFPSLVRVPSERAEDKPTVVENEKKPAAKTPKKNGEVEDAK